MRQAGLTSGLTAFLRCGRNRSMVGLRTPLTTSPGGGLQGSGGGTNGMGLDAMGVG